MIATMEVFKAVFALGQAIELLAGDLRYGQQEQNKGKLVIVE